jgi:hypothetical protein
MTLSTTMYYCGFDPYSGKKVFIARGIDEKRKQKEYFFWYSPRRSGKIVKKTRKPGR